MKRTHRARVDSRSRNRKTDRVTYHGMVWEIGKPHPLERAVAFRAWETDGKTAVVLIGSNASQFRGADKLTTDRVRDAIYDALADSDVDASQRGGVF